MAGIENGLVERVKEYLEGMGAQLTVEDTFSELYALDFIITRFKGVHAHVNLGVHVTTTHDNTEELSRFIQAARRGVVVKAIYIEVSEDAVQTGGVVAVLGACLSVLFDRRLGQHRAVGVRILEDCSFQFFEVEETLQRLERHFEDDLVIGSTLAGQIIAYFTDKGFGFVQDEEERKFFFHIANVVDDELRTRLPGYVLGESIPVEFQFGGNDGKKYPKAINVVLSDEEYDSEGYRD